jgi:putative zinc finger protein
MTCRDVRELADSFVDDALGTETTGEILWHLATCSTCRSELDGRRTLRRSLKTAFDRAPDLQPPTGFTARLRTNLSGAADPSNAHRTDRRRWLALAASMAIVAGLSAWALQYGSTAPLDKLALDAVGDHWNCGLKNRAVRTPVPLEQAAQRFDGAYRLLLTVPADHVSTSNGLVSVLERHSCAFGTRRFGHVILEYQGKLVSLLLTQDDGNLSDGSMGRDAAAHVHGPFATGFTVVSVRGSGHTVLLVSDLATDDLVRLSDAISRPLAQKLAESGLVTFRLPEAYAHRKECDGA